MPDEPSTGTTATASAAGASATPTAAPAMAILGGTPAAATPAATAAAPAAAVAAPAPTLESLHDAAIAAVAAWQADPAKAELKTAADTALATAKEAAGKAQKALGEMIPPPDKYELKPAADTKLTADRVAEIAAFAKANKLSQAQAQSVMERENTTLTAVAKAQEDFAVKTKQEWIDGTMNDPVIGGDKLKAVAEQCRRVVEKFAPAAEPWAVKFREELVTSGLGNHPGLLRFVNNIAQSMGDDQLVQGAGQGGGSAKSAGAKIFEKSLAESNASSSAS